jgi:hypothetical protein
MRASPSSDSESLHSGVRGRRGPGILVAGSRLDAPAACSVASGSLQLASLPECISISVSSSDLYVLVYELVP